MKLTRALAVLAAVLSATPAFAADTCSFREYQSLGNAHGFVAQIAQEPGITDQNSADFTSSPWQSAAFNVATAYIVVICNVNTSYLVGTNPTAANTNLWFPASQPWVIGVPVGQSNKISFTHNP